MREQELGDHIDQRGSIVLPERLRFDFSHSRVVEPASLQRIEALCVATIGQDLAVHSREVPLEQAHTINGAPLGARNCPTMSKSFLVLSALHSTA